MVWFIVLGVIIALCGIIYLFLPMLKKLKNSKPTSKSKENKEVKKSIKADKKQQKEDKKLERKLEKLYTYAHLKHDEDTAEPLAKSLENRASGKAAAISAACAWFEPELLAIDDEKISAMLNEKVLEFYKPSIEELLRAKKHTLSEKEERILGALSDVLGAPDEIYETLTDADLRFPLVKDTRGKKLELTHGSYRRFIESADRKVRKRAFKAMFESYKNIINTCAR